MSIRLPGVEFDSREFFIRRWSQEYPAFLDVFKALPPDRLDFRPHPGSRSAGELVSLLVSIERGCVELCETRRSSYKSAMRGRSTKSTILGQMIQAYIDHHRLLANKLTQLNASAWDRAASLTRGEQEIILKDTVGGLLWLAFFDALHHRGQLSAYIRPMGGKVPSISGPSADAAALQ